MEFLAYISLTMFILAALYTVMTVKQQDTFDRQTQEAAEMVAEKASFQVEMALVQGEGYSRVFSLPRNIGGENYTLSLKEGNTILKYDDRSMVRPTRYRGDLIQVKVDDDTGVFRVKHNASGVFLVEE